MDIREKTFNKLELYKIKDELLKFSNHPLSYRMIKELDLAKDFNQCEDRLFETASGLDLLRKYPDIPLGVASDMEETLNRIDAEYILNIRDVFYIKKLIYSVKKVINYFSNKDVGQVYNRIISLLVELKGLSIKIDEIIDDSGDIKSTASPSLLKIRKELKTKSLNIRRTVENILKKKTYQKYLQDEVIVNRGESYCLSVKKEFAYKIPGIIEDTSASGNTVFIEPLEVRNLRSEVKLLEKKSMKR